MRTRDQRQQKKLRRRRQSLLVLWIVLLLVVVARSAEVQVAEGTRWREVALQQHQTTKEVPAPRGAILDRDGFPLALSREMVRVSVAPPELRDVEQVERLLVERLGLSPAEARRHTDPGRRWSVVPGTHEPSAQQAFSGLRGVYLERVHRRFHPRGELALGLLGAVIDGVGRGGVEEAFDEVLRGRTGREVAARDHRGRQIPGETFVLAPRIAGGELTLTIDLDLQEIAHEALSQAIESTSARGGDLLVTDPHTGEILALASFRDGRSDVLSAVTTPYEPGSTLKPFTVSAILEHGAGRLTDSIDTKGGVWMVGGRSLTDVHDYGTLTLGDALRVSSNVGVAMATRSLEPARQYETLRDFGFGVNTGIPLPGEAPGTLRRPDRWSARSFASLAIGYELAATPLQMAMAYGALANGGVLMEPRLVREVRTSGEQLLDRAGPRALRRVVSESVTREVAAVLVDVVEEGTGTAARLGTYQVAGKTGTSRAYAAGGGYQAGNYFSSFGAFFPAGYPQLVVFVKLEAPRGVYYGGATAAPVTRETVEAVLAARTSGLDRQALLRVERRPNPRSRTSSPVPEREIPPAHSARTSAHFAALDLSVPAGDRYGVRATHPASAGRVSAVPVTLIDSWPSASTPRLRVPARAQTGVPDVTGLSSRVAARKLHSAGFRVSWEGEGRVFGTIPRAGSEATPGDTVRLLGQSGRP